MLQSHQVEELICLVAALDRAMLIEQFRTYRASFPVDFTPEFLETLSDDRLRHIFVAMCLQCQRLPESPAHAA
ncbi:MAG TPA: hypothetical protein VIL86_18245 [Tepidisphaeraceae bacterium]|jgi:hypothetical protein